MMISPRRELDACGIGFVADATGRARRDVVTAALGGLAGVRHRGAVGADARSSDGCGLLLPIPAALFGADHGVAVLFSRGPEPRPAVEAALAAEGLSLLDWRTPPTDHSVLGEQAATNRPRIIQVVFALADETLTGGTAGASTGDWQGRSTAQSPMARSEQAERRAYRLGRRIHATARGTYVASCSFRSLVYKALVTADALASYFLDLADERVVAPFALFHQRFSTNTLPTWERAQPFSMLAHNGEINALAGNANRMKSRSMLGTAAVGLGPEELFHPLLDETDSDSGQLNTTIEFLTRAGREVRHTVAMTIPEAWEGERDLDPAVRAFYRYQACLMEPWDGPAGLVFTDGLRVGAALDRNGLRPLRYAICDDGLVAVCSESGAIDLGGRGGVRRGRLGPGQMLFIDPDIGGFVGDRANKAYLAALAPWGRWVAEGQRSISRGRPIEAVGEPDDLVTAQSVHGWSKEEMAMVLRPMAADAKEPTFSMGDDSPLPPLAGRPRPVHHFFKQRFAQVTNPPIDHLRERLVMSLRTLLGPRAPICSSGPEATHLLALKSFFVYPSTVDSLLAGSGATDGFDAVHLDATFAVAEGPAGLRAAVERLGHRAAEAVAAGASICVIDDTGIGSQRAPIPALAATGAVHHRLVEAGLRPAASLVVRTNDCRDVHYTACLLGYGADAVCPELALATVAAEADANLDSDISGPEAQQRLQAATEDGVMKIMSKMGISSVDSYRGAQIFEIIGLGPEVVDLCFAGTPSVVGGLGWAELGADVLARHGEGRLGDGGYYRVRKRGEYHTHGDDVTKALNQMKAAHLLQAALRDGRDDLYDGFAELVNGRSPAELHDLVDFVPAGPPVPLDEVEPARAITRRFSTGAMSHGALSREAHETLAEAMNMIGAMSNCGEGGESRRRFETRGRSGPEGGDKNSRIKQIASGRFGVTPEYCAFADELNIKMAQGSKPGEGGQIPGNKVSQEIAALRHTQPGIGLISPPPHHDIYSIEDLAQLIFDLKQVNRLADVSVKLVAEDGVGTIAAGVAKALAEVVHISGCNGGTGASPLSSIKHAGLPWELGLADTQAALVANGLRSRIRVRIDGGLMTGRDVLVGAFMGADEFSFGTAAMIAEGCIMLRACHKDTCSTGVATQRPHLRAKFAGTPAGVAAYMLFVAEEVRRGLAAVGLRTLDDAIGRVECLRPRVLDDSRAMSMDLSPLITPPANPDAPRRFLAPVPIQKARSALGDRLVADAYRRIWDGEDFELAYSIANTDRTVGAALSGALALEFGSVPPPGTVTVRLAGSAGQSFGAFLGHGIELHLEGEANDYVGKAMAGGRISIRPGPETRAVTGHLDSGSPVLAGNTCLYGATGGDLFLAGVAGERFGVRNSGASAVVEGVGDHACEYMTGGTVVIIGPVGHNLGAGMTGGRAFVHDPTGNLASRLNSALVDTIRPDPDLAIDLRWMIERHLELTSSVVAAKLLSNWETELANFWLVAPADEIRRLTSQQASQVTTSA
ncbi:MAG: glutamate synthase large subunit [Acidimicrobiales bacterium]